ncbi:hypothetical protein MMU60_13395, partial [Escherichia coli]|uniref:hypothetical protein n=1 Tax=Escherichia coli TaxID=562 RepID=UPI001F132E28
RYQKFSYYPFLVYELTLQLSQQCGLYNTLKLRAISLQTGLKPKEYTGSAISVSDLTGKS